MQDLRYSLRLLLKTPGFTLAAVLVLALGIGANAAVFSLVNGIVFKPLAGSQRPGRVVGIYSHDRTRPDTYRGFSYPAFVDVRDQAKTFSDVAAFTLAFIGVGEGDAIRRSFCAVVTARYFAVLGVDLMAGRTFTSEEEKPRAATAVAIVSYQYWKSHGGDPSLVGKTVRINSRTFTIIGITRAGFTGTSVLVAPEVWVPTGANELVVNDFMRADEATSLADRRNTSLMLIGRLRPGITEPAAEPELRTLSSQLEAAYPAENRNQQLGVHRLPRVSISTSPQDDHELMMPFVVLMAMAAVVLLVASLNLANMMLARGTARRKEVAMRLALGGTRGHVVRQLLTEGAMIAVSGGAAGLFLGYWAISLLVSTLVPLSPIPLAADMSPDMRVVAATLGFCAIATVVFGLGPAWKLARTDLVSSIKAQTDEDVRARWFGRFGGRNLLVAAQIALCLGLLTAAGLFMRGAIKAGGVDPGYRLDGQIVASVDTTLAGYDEAQSRNVYRRVMERLRSIPGVQSASFASVVAFGDISESKTIQKGGTPPSTGKDGRRVGTDASYYVVGADYFKTLGVPVLRGREFTPAEEQGDNGPAVAIIDEPLARALFPGEDAVGRQIQFARDPGAPSGSGMVIHDDSEGARVMQVVGVVKGLRHDLFDKAPVAHIYVPYGTRFRSWMNLHVRLAGNGASSESPMLQTVRRELRAADQRLPILSLTTLTEHRDSSVSFWIVKAGARIFTIFGLVAMFLAIIGLYAVKAYVVARRTREIGIRMALGSTPRQILGLVLKEGAFVTAAGLAVGILLAAGIGQVIGSMLYDVSSFDPLVFAVAALGLGAAAMAACYPPARRATQVVPIKALRSE